MRKYKTRVYFDILIEISEHVILLRLMNSLGYANHAISLVRYWIFNSKYEKALVVNRESSDMIFAPPVGKEQVTTYEICLCCEIHSINSATKEGIVYIYQLNNRFIHYITIIKTNMDN